MTYMSDYTGTGHSPVDEDDPPEFGWAREEYDREVEEFLADHYDDGANFGGEG